MYPTRCTGVRFSHRSGPFTAIAVREVIAGAGENAEELIEAVAVRAELGFPSQVPLADEGRVVSVALQQRGHRRVIGRQAVVDVSAICNRLEQPDLEPLRVSARDERASRRRAHGRRRIRAHELDALRGQPVEDRRLVVGPPVAAQVAVPEIVGQDEEHVGTLGSLRQSETQCRERARGGGGRVQELASCDCAGHD